MAAPSLRSAARLHAAQQRLITIGVAQARQTWLTKAFSIFAAILGGLQHEAAINGVTAADEMIAELEIDAPPVAAVDTVQFAGVTSAGADLETFLKAAKSEVDLEMAAITQIMDAARVAEGVSVTSRPAVYGYIRVVNSATCCSRCAVLAGRFYKWSDGFLRHPNCFPAGTVVSGPPALYTTRRWYEGELAIFRTASGQQVSVTANHPILTDKGWVAANRLDVGDRVVHSTRDQGATSLVVPDEQQRPALIEDLWSADGVVPLGKVPTTTEDFHGDGLDGKVDVVAQDRLLRDWLQPGVAEFLPQHPLADGAEFPLALDGLGLFEQALRRPLRSPDRSVGGLDILGPNLGWGVARAESLSLGRRPRWDAPVSESPADDAAAYAEVGSDLLRRLAGQVSLDSIVDYRRVEFADHVYNLTTSEGWYSANGIIASNCQCSMIPVEIAAGYGIKQTPQELFDNGQIHDLTVAETQAINDGADIGQVVNIRRKAAGLTEAGRVISRLERLTPEGIYHLASDRDEAISLLRRFGYLVSR